MGVLTRNPDSDSDDDIITSFIEKQISLFSDEKYVRQKDGLFCDPNDINHHHPLQKALIAKKEKKKNDRIHTDDFDIYYHKQGEECKENHIDSEFEHKMRLRASEKRKNFKLKSGATRQTMSMSVDKGLIEKMKTIFGDFSQKELLKCQRNIYSDDDSLSENSDEFSFVKNQN